MDNPFIHSINLHRKSDGSPYLYEQESMKIMKIISSNISLTILYDNDPVPDNDLETGWGFSCLIQGVGETILFDTGAREDILLSNMKKLGVSPSDIDVIILSHFHGDHTGGIDALLEENHDLSVYFPSSFSKGFLERILSTGAGIVPVTNHIRIMPGVSVTSETGGETREIALVIETERGLVIVTGCAHPGLMTILKEAGSISADSILMIIGGLHLEAYSRYELEHLAALLAKKGILYLAPCHCSGSLAKTIFKSDFEGFIETGVGRKILLKDL